MKAYKAFNQDWTCLGFKYEIGKTYTHDRNAVLCQEGFHACEAPLDVLTYYPLTSKFAEVELDGIADQQHSDDTKRVAKMITVNDELSIAGLISAQIEWVNAQSDTNQSSGYYSTAAASGDHSKAASSGDNSKAAASGNHSTAASSGDHSKAASSGDNSKAAASGNYSTAASSGNDSKAAASGYNSEAAASGNHSTAAASGDHSKAASSGYYSTAAASGDHSTAAASGDDSTAEANGEAAIAMVAGVGGRARAGKNGAFALAWKDGDQMRIAVGIVGENGIKPDTLYRVVDGTLQAVY